MSDIKSIDKDGDWYVNTGEQRLPDYGRQAEDPNSDLVLLEPGVPTRIKASAWLLSQPTLQKIDDPFGDAPAPKAGKK